MHMQINPTISGKVAHGMITLNNLNHCLHSVHFGKKVYRKTSTVYPPYLNPPKLQDIQGLEIVRVQYRRYR
jgi:hypothetical protein